MEKTGKFSQVLLQFLFDSLDNENRHVGVLYYIMAYTAKEQLLEPALLKLEYIHVVFFLYIHGQ
jgi:hypothetical protein